MSALDFSLAATGETTFTLSENLPCVVYFYPKDNTPGCTNESLDFKAQYAAFEVLGVTVVGISRDSIKSHENFKAKYELPFALLSDKDETVCTQFDVIKMKKLYGKEVRGIERSTFFVDKTGQIAHEWRKVKVPEHVAEVLSEVRDILSK